MLYPDELRSRDLGITNYELRMQAIIQLLVDNLYFTNSIIKMRFRWFFVLLLFPIMAFSSLWEIGEKGVVKQIIDGDSFVLDSGLIVRLAQIEAPKIIIGDDEGEKARKFLQELILNKKVILKYGGLKRDRMGRALAQVFIDDGANTWVNIELLKTGHARVHTYKDNRANIIDFWIAEREARRNALGLWLNPKYQARYATQPALIGAEGSFQLVEGKVLNVTQTAGIIKIEFGHNQEKDFTAIIPQASWELFEGGKYGILNLKGMNIRVRGKIQAAVIARQSKTGKNYHAHGPQIWLDHPELIEYIMIK